MKKLEEQVGHPLLKREPGGIKATVAGERFLVHARRILRAHEDAIVDFSGMSDTAGHLMLGLSADYGQALLPRVLGVLAGSYPKLSVEVVCAPSRDLYEMCTDGRVEIAFVGEGEGLGQSPVLHRERLVGRREETCTIKTPFRSPFFQPRIPTIAAGRSTPSLALVASTGSLTLPIRWQAFRP